MSEIVSCLLRVGENLKKYKIIKLDHEQITVGRSVDANYVILSNMISRCHAIFKHQDETWTITDNKSLNGVFVNGKQLSPSNPYTLKDGDMVQFGVPVSANVPAEFIYKFYSSLKIRIEKKAKKFKGDSQETSLQSDLSQISDNGSEADDEREQRRKLAKVKTVQKDEINASDEQRLAKEAEYQAKLAEMERLLREKEEKQSEVEKQLEQERNERKKKSQEVAELKEKEQIILMEMQDKQAQMEKDKDELKKKIQAELESTLKKKELALRAQLTSDKESLMKEKQNIEENLQAEMAKALEEKDKEVENQLIKMKEDLEKVIQDKDKEQKLLEVRLNETREESEMAKLKALKARDDVMSDFADIMEMELQCSICNELFIKAVTLNCAHVFCKLCINQWMKVKKECPNCRKAVISQMQSVSLDSYIEKMVERLSDDLKARRKSIVEHRKAEQDKFDGVVAGSSGISRTAARPVNVTTPVNDTIQQAATRQSSRIQGRQRGRGRGRGRDMPRATTTNASTSVTTTTATPNTAETTGTSVIVVEGAASTSRSVLASATSNTSTTTVTSVETAATPQSTVSDITSTSPSEITSIEISDDDEDEENEEDEEEEYYRSRYSRRRYEFSSEEEENSDDNGDEVDGNDSLNLSAEDDVEGIPGRYYGGYGRCFKCGNRGHWANGCPLL